MKTIWLGTLIALLAVTPVQAATTNKASELPVTAALTGTNTHFMANTNIGGAEKTVMMPPFWVLEIFKRLANWPADALNTNGSTPAITFSNGTNTWSLPWASAVKNGLITSNDWAAFNAKTSGGLTNGDTRYLIFNGGVRFEITTTNGQVARFEDDIVQVAGNAATLGNTSIAGTASVLNGLYLDGISVLVGNGSPESVVSARPQSLFLQTNQSAGIGLYLKTNGTGNTGWWLLAPGGGGGSGTVTSVAASSSTLSVSGSPITGSGTLVLNISTNAITTQTEDTAPATNDFILTADTSTASAKKTALGNLPVSGAQATINANLQAATNALSTVVNDADVTDLIDGSLTGSKVGSGIDAANITIGTLPIARLGTGNVGATELASTAVTAGSYTAANITVDADGRITAAANGSATTSSNFPLANLGQVYITNITFNASTNLGSNAVQVWNTVLHKRAEIAIHGNTTLVMTNMPIVTNAAGLLFNVKYEADIYALSTNQTFTIASEHPITINGEAYLAPGITNKLFVEYNNGRWSATFGSVRTEGTGSFMRTRTGVRRTIWVDASYFNTNGAGSSATSPGVMTSASNGADYNYQLFSGAAAQTCNAGFPMPPEWDRGNITVVPHWTATNSSGDIVWQLAVDYADNDDSVDGAFGSYTTSTDTLLSTSDYHIAPATGAITFGNAPGAASGRIKIKVYRDPGHASNTLDVNAFLFGVQLQYTESTTEPVALP